MKAIIAISSVLSLIASTGNAQLGGTPPVSIDQGDRGGDVTDQQEEDEPSGQRIDELSKRLFKALHAARGIDVTKGDASMFSRPVNKRKGRGPSRPDGGERGSRYDVDVNGGQVPISKLDSSSLGSSGSAGIPARGDQDEGSRPGAQRPPKFEADYQEGSHDLAKAGRGNLQANASASQRRAQDDPSSDAERPSRPEQQSRPHSRFDADHADGDKGLQKADADSLSSNGTAANGRTQPQSMYGTPEVVQAESSSSRDMASGSFSSGLSSSESQSPISKDEDALSAPDERQVGGQIFDDGPTLSGAVKYGEGFSGTNGIPALSYLGDVASGSTIRLFVENSSGVSSTGLLSIGSSAMEMKLRGGATVLADSDVALLRLRLEPGTNEIEFTIPAGVEGDLYMQAAQVDAGAIGGWSFTQGLQLQM